jgi:hypothetical protein
MKAYMSSVEELQKADKRYARILRALYKIMELTTDQAIYDLAAEVLNND